MIIKDGALTFPVFELSWLMIGNSFPIFPLIHFFYSMGDYFMVIFGYSAFFFFCYIGLLGMTHERFFKLSDLWSNPENKMETLIFSHRMQFKTYAKHVQLMRPLGVSYVWLSGHFTGPQSIFHICLSIEASVQVTCLKTHPNVGWAQPGLEWPNPFRTLICTVMVQIKCVIINCSSISILSKGPCVLPIGIFDASGYHLEGIIARVSYQPCLGLSKSWF